MMLQAFRDLHARVPDPGVGLQRRPSRRVEVCASHTAVAQGATPVLHLTTANMITRLLAALALASASAKVFFEGEFRPSQRTRGRAAMHDWAAALDTQPTPPTRCICCNAKPPHCHLRATTAATRPRASTHHPRTTPRDAAAAPTLKHTTTPNAPRPRDAQRPSTRTSASAGRYRNGRTPTAPASGSTRRANGSSNPPRRRPTACRRRRT